MDLPGLKKEDVKVEVTDGYLSISGGRKTESEETKDGVYRSERSYGSFYRELPAKAETKPHTVKIEDGARSGTKAAA